MYLPKNSSKQPFNSWIAITTLLFIVLMCWLGYSIFVNNQAFLYAENGPLENTQVFILSIACLIFLLPVLTQSRNDKLFLLFFSLLCISFVLREVDIEDLNVPNILISIGSGTGRNIMLSIGFFAIFLCMAINIAHYKKVLKFYGLSRGSLLIFVAGILLGIGAFFEEMSFVPHYVFFEEMLELSGYVIILLVAYIWSKNSSQQF